MDWQECEEKMCVSERNKMTGLFLDRDQMAASQKFITEAEAAYQHIESRIRVEEQIAAAASNRIVNSAKLQNLQHFVLYGNTFFSIG